MKEEFGVQTDGQGKNNMTPPKVISHNNYI